MESLSSQGQVSKGEGLQSLIGHPCFCLTFSSVELNQNVKIHLLLFQLIIRGFFLNHIIIGIRFAPGY